MTGTSDQAKGRSLRDHHLFMEVVKVFNALDVPFWLDQGTLLGIVREGRLLKEDHDLDLGIWAEDYRRARAEIVKKLRQKGRWIETFKPHQLSITDLDDRLEMINIAFYKRVDGKAKKIVYYPVSNKAVDFFTGVAVFSAYAAWGRVEKKLPSGRPYRLLLAVTKIIPARLWILLCYCAGRIQYFFKPSFVMAVPEHYFLQLQPVSVQRLSLPVPANVEAYLELKYGADWRKPKAKWVYWKDDGAIIR